MMFGLEEAERHRRVALSLVPQIAALRRKEQEANERLHHAIATHPKPKPLLIDERENVLVEEPEHVAVRAARAAYELAEETAARVWTQHDWAEGLWRLISAFEQVGVKPEHAEFMSPDGPRHVFTGYKVQAISVDHPPMTVLSPALVQAAEALFSQAQVLKGWKWPT